MSEEKLKVRIPEFLKQKDIEDYKPSRKSALIEEYKNRFGEFAIMGMIFTSQGEMEELLERCINENKTVEQITGIDFSCEEDEEI